MNEKIESIVKNEIIKDDSSIWRLKNHYEFDYSDGAASEKYLQGVFHKAIDLSSRSVELENYIKDWSSEYHLSMKRAQLLSGFNFNRALHVLEVGCGCGAITRFLGENFTQVVSIEGSINRARLARERTRDLESVSIISAPFQDIQFTKKFDIIFCIGVYEYSAAFVSGDDPYNEVLKYFSDMLTPEGIVVIAIENQFGLKYFNNSREDHLCTMFEGLEGYHRKPDFVKTFGKIELETRIKKHFPKIEFYYPYPDYKIPDCILSSEFISSGQAGELVSQIRSRDYGGSKGSLWDESAMILELNRNRVLDFFSNSFLVVAGKQSLSNIEFNQLGLMFSLKRSRNFRTMSRIVKSPGNHVSIIKSRIFDDQPITQPVTSKGALTLTPATTEWVNDISLNTRTRLRAKKTDSTLEHIFSENTAWVDFLKRNSLDIKGVRFVSGEFIDATWSNVYLGPKGISIIDKEWEWSEKISINVLVIRAIYYFLADIGFGRGFSVSIYRRSPYLLIRKIGLIFRIDLGWKDFKQFIKLEMRFQRSVSGFLPSFYRFKLIWTLVHRPSYRLMRSIENTYQRILAKVFARFNG